MTNVQFRILIKTIIVCTRTIVGRMDGGYKCNEYAMKTLRELEDMYDDYESNLTQKSI